MATQQKRETRLRRKKRIRKKVSGDTERPRLTVFRSNKHIYAQVIDDVTHHALAAASDVPKKGAAGELDGKDKKERAKAVGKAVAKACADKGIKRVVFDRNGYAFHGRVHALADGAREGGLEF